MSDDILLDRPHLFLGSRLKRVAEQLQSDVIRVSEAHGLSVQPGQYPLLATLERYGPKTIGALAASMKLTQPTVTRTVVRLQRLNLVQIDHRSADRRHKTVSLTLAGEAAMSRSKTLIWPEVERAVEAALADLSGSLLQQLEGLEARLGQGPLAPAAVVTLEPALADDIPAVVALLNVAFRGTGADAGWNSEAEYMEGDRTTVANLRAELAANPQAVLLLVRSGATEISGCVLLEPTADGVWRLGSLAINPKGQNAGLGRRVLSAAERWAWMRGATEIHMTVVNVRLTLIAWYERRGYRLTGERHAFPYEDDRFGVPRRSDLSFVGLSKRLEGRTADGVEAGAA